MMIFYFFPLATVQYACPKSVLCKAREKKRETDEYVTEAGGIIKYGKNERSSILIQAKLVKISPAEPLTVIRLH